MDETEIYWSNTDTMDYSNSVSEWGIFDEKLCIDCGAEASLSMDCPEVVKMFGKELHLCACCLAKRLGLKPRDIYNQNKSDD